MKNGIVYSNDIPADPKKLWDNEINIIFWNLTKSQL